MINAYLMHMSNRIRTTLTLDKNVIKRAKELDINISAAAERGILDYIREMENIRRYPSNHETNKDDDSKCKITPRRERISGCRTGDRLRIKKGIVRVAILSALLILMTAGPLLMKGSAGTLNNFTTGVDTGLPSSGDYSYIIGEDVNGDNDIDIAFGGEDYGSASSQGLYFYRGNGAGTWTSTSTGLPTKDTWGGIQFADADGDDKIEIYAGNEGWGTHSGSIKGVGAWEFSSNKWLSSGITQPYNGTSAYVNDIKVLNFTKTSGVDIAIATSTSSGTSRLAADSMTCLIWAMAVSRTSSLISKTSSS